MEKFSPVSLSNLFTLRRYEKSSPPPMKSKTFEKQHLIQKWNDIKVFWSFFKRNNKSCKCFQSHKKRTCGSNYKFILIKCFQKIWRFKMTRYTQKLFENSELVYLVKSWNISYIFQSQWINLTAFINKQIFIANGQMIPNLKYQRKSLKSDMQRENS